MVAEMIFEPRHLRTTQTQQPAGFGEGKAAADVFFGEHVEVGAEFVGEFGVVAMARKHAATFCGENS
ncbi:MAG TPA: hypothetical protein VKS20_07365 [Candidatus Acidoferrales bacterium]|nr:hypothetical protein [Candidatus Acidoferrales bacterium]